MPPGKEVVELRHWRMKWNGELRLGSDSGMRAGCWSTGIGEGVDGLIADVSVTPTSRESEVMVVVVVVVVVVSLGRGSSVVGTGLQDDVVCDRVAGGILYVAVEWRGIKTTGKVDAAVKVPRLALHS